MLKLNNISPPKNSTQPRKRKGRGIGSGIGKTSGRGHKGQKSRSGSAMSGYEGGQTSINKRLPKRGFNSIKPKIAVINLSTLESAINKGLIDPHQMITETYLYDCGITSKRDHFVKILGKGKLNYKLNICVAFASRSAIHKIINKGGAVINYKHSLVYDSDTEYTNDTFKVAENSDSLFNSVMNYTVHSSFEDEMFSISIDFNFLSKDLEGVETNELFAIIDCPSAEMEAHALPIGKDARISDDKNYKCRYDFSLPRSKDLKKSDSQYNKLYLTILYRNNFLHKKKIELSNSI